MCGICGKISLNGERVKPELLARMTSVLSHRGPDGEGTHVHHGAHVSAGLGHRRLSIIDLSEAGRQPMSNEDGTLWIVFNGEIYNFQALRDDLKKKGHRFKSGTDTEVILHLYEDEGVEGIDRLEGMFAFAVWDEKSESLVLVRDRIGIKPLVYYQDERSFLFSSEIKSLLQDPNVPQEMDRHALDLYLTFNYIPAPYTIFRNIRKLKPGYYLLFRNGRLEEKEYWNLQGRRDIPNPSSMHPEVQKESLFNALDEAVRSHMIADVPIGAFLSGGIDSSIIVGLMSRNSSNPVRTYTIGYENTPLFDETKYARDVAILNGTDHHEIILSSSNILSTIPLILDAFDEPFADSSAIPAFVVSRETARNLKVVLSGDGGDELFAGYRMYAGEYWHSIYGFLPSVIRRGLIAPLLLALPDSRDALLTDYVRRVKKFIRGDKNEFADRFVAWNEIFQHKMREDILLPAASCGNSSLGKRILESRLKELEDDRINQMLYADFKESLPGDMLHKVDAMSMLNSLEVRVPLLDHRICELAFSFPGDSKFRRGKGKRILIETFKDILPGSLLNRPKRGFEVPISSWLKKDLKFLIEEYLSPAVIKNQGIFHDGAVNTLIRNLYCSRADTSWQIWNLIVFQNWYCRYIEDIRG